MQTKNVSKAYRFREFPKMVYRLGAKSIDEIGATKIINSEDERPEGFVDHDEWVRGSVSEASADAGAGAVLAQQAAERKESEKAAADAEAARKEASEKKAAEEAAAQEEQKKVAEERERIKAKLEEHKVDFAPQLGLQKLQELESQLDAYLAEKAKNEAENGSDTPEGNGAE